MNLIDLTVTEFTRKVASSSPAPGGGSIAALSGALGAALCSMVAGLTLGKKKYEASGPFMDEVQKKSALLQENLLAQVDKDTLAYNRVVDAYELPKASPIEIDLRSKAIQDALKHAAKIPCQTLETAALILSLAELAIEKGNPGCITDAGVAAELSLAAVQGAAYNVCVNLMGIDDKQFSKDLRQKVLRIQQDTHGRIEQIRKTVETAIKMEPCV